MVYSKKVKRKNAKDISNLEEKKYPEKYFKPGGRFNKNGIITLNLSSRED